MVTPFVLQFVRFHSDGCLVGVGGDDGDGDGDDAEGAMVGHVFLTGCSVGDTLGFEVGVFVGWSVEGPWLGLLVGTDQGFEDGEASEG